MPPNGRTLLRAAWHTMCTCRNITSEIMLTSSTISVSVERKRSWMSSRVATFLSSSSLNFPVLIPHQLCSVLASNYNTLISLFHYNNKIILTDRNYLNLAVEKLQDQLTLLIVPLCHKMSAVCTFHAPADFCHFQLGQ